jgi:hypothetical protein
MAQLCYRHGTSAPVSDRGRKKKQPRSSRIHADKATKVKKILIRVIREDPWLLFVSA